MIVPFACFCLLFVAEPHVATEFVQLAPKPNPALLNMWSRQHPRAVVLIHGLLFRPLSETPAKSAVLHSWQRSDSLLVKTLAKESDVFALAYSQNTPIDEVAASPALPGYIARLRMMGYREIVLLGHSAGGILARQLVEDQPQVGITKVIQISTPNGGSSLAKATAVVRKGQEPFMESLTKEARQKQLRVRAAKRVPDNMEFVCIVTAGGTGSDGFVGAASQWTEDLQQQHIPAIVLPASHHLVLRTKHNTEQIARAIR